MKYTEVWENFIQMEKELDLFSRKIDGIYIWELIRDQVFTLLMQKKAWIYRQAHTQIDSNLMEKIKIVFSSSKHYIFNNPFFAPQKKFVFAGHQRRKLLDDNLYWDIYCDFFLDSLNDDYVYLEEYYLNSHLKPAKTKNIFYCDFLLLLTSLKKRILFEQKSAKAVNEFANQINDTLNKIFCVQLDLYTVIQNIKNTYELTCPLYEKVLKKINPEIVFVVVSSGREILISAAKKLQIPVVELQHGAISKYNMGYSFPYNQTKHTFPDYFFSFGEYSRQLVKFPISKERVINIGYPFLAESLKKYSNTQQNNTILFISQNTIGKELSQFAVKFKEIAPDNISVIYKLHSGEYDCWRKAYPWLEESDIQVIDGQTPGLYELFSTAKWQVGVYSTAIYEGLTFGCQTYLVDLPGVASVNDLIESGYAQLVSIPEEIALDYKKTDIDRNYFFTEGWKANFNSALSNILHDK